MTLFFPPRALCGLALLAALLAVGCQRAEIHKYEAPILPIPKAPFEYEMPEGWLFGPPSRLSIFSLQAEEGGELAVMTVTSLSGPAGGLLENVNRWRGQVKLPPLTEAQLQEAIQTRTVSGLASKYVEILGKENAILGAIVPREGETLFFKFMGPTDLVNDNKAAFDKFLGSVKFAAGGGANHGK